LKKPNCTAFSPSACSRAFPTSFSNTAFRTVEDKSELPDKIFKDCQICPRLHRCDEVAMVRGRIPRMSILGPREEAQQLVRLSG
jgi:amino-acid N-acetyltransferase